VRNVICTLWCLPSSTPRTPQSALGRLGRLLSKRMVYQLRMHQWWVDMWARERANKDNTHSAISPPSHGARRPTDEANPELRSGENPQEGNRIGHYSVCSGRCLGGKRSASSSGKYACGMRRSVGGGPSKEILIPFVSRRSRFSASAYASAASVFFSAMA